MIKRTITYTDYNGVERTEDFYFNLTKAEILEMELSTSGGLSEMITKLAAELEVPAILKIFKTLLLKAYGEKSLDGKYFNKSEEISNNFSHTEAFSILYTELATDDKKAAEFFKALTPSATKESVNNENDTSSIN